MTLMSYLLASHALMAEHGFHVETAEQPADVAARNAESMNALMGVMAQVQGAPKIS